MAEMILAWPTLISADRLTLAPRANERLRDAAVEVERQVRPAGDPRHFSSLVDDHAEVFPQRYRADLDALWAEVTAAVRRHLARAFAVTAAHPLDWTLTVLVARQGDRLSAHSHPQRDLVAAYYPHIDPLDDDPANLNRGELRFLDNRGWGRKWINRNPALFDKAYLSLCPEPGMLVIAPGYALHETSTFNGPGLRVTYGFFINVRMTKEYV